MIKLTLVGNLGRDAEVRQVGNQSVISFNVAHSERYTDRNGQRQERTTWVRCSYWRDPSRTRVADYLKTGTQVYVEGVPTVSQYTRNDGTPGASLDLRVMYLELLGSRGESNTGGGGGGYDGNYGSNTPSNNPSNNPSPQNDDNDVNNGSNDAGSDDFEDDLPF